MSKLEEANEIIRDLAEEIKKDDGIIEQLRADLEAFKRQAAIECEAKHKLRAELDEARNIIKFIYPKLNRVAIQLSVEQLPFLARHLEALVNKLRSYLVLHSEDPAQ